MSTASTPRMQAEGRTRSRPIRCVLMAAMIACLIVVEVRLVTNTSASAPLFPLPYTGVNYYDPSEYFTRCPSYTWLQSSCWDNPALSDTPKAQLASDLSFVSQSHIVGTLSASISLDELLQWNSQTGATGFAPGALANVDDMLSIFHQYGVKVMLALFVYDHPGAENEFRPWAIDGNHRAVEQNYLRAAHEFIQHLASNPVDAATVPIIDLQDEAYYQFEVYYQNPAHLGKFGQCRTSSNKVDTGCVDTKIVYPWLKSLYDTARSASGDFLYTISDTHRLFEDYKAWVNMYPVDVIDEHVYDSEPWAHAAMYAQAKHWSKPWFVGEAGCDSYATACTYADTPAGAARGLKVDTWWLNNLVNDGAQTVFVEDKHTAWGYNGNGVGQVPTAVGQELVTATANIHAHAPTAGGDPSPTPTAVPSLPGPGACPGGKSAQPFVTSFDRAKAGAVRASYSKNHFNGVFDPNNIEIENFFAYSRPAALAVRIPAGGGSAYVYRSFMHDHLGCTLRFGFVLGHGFNLGRNNYMVLAETRAGSQSNTTRGDVELDMGPSGNLFLSYTDANGSHAYLYTGGRLRVGDWYTVTLREEAGKNGYLALSVDGKVEAAHAHVDLAAGPIRYFALGDKYTPHAASSHAVIYFDDVSFTK